MQKCSLGAPVIALYVEDLLMGCNNDSMVLGIKERLIKAFKMKDLGETRLSLEVNIHRDRKTKQLSLPQSKYASKIIFWFTMGAAKRKWTPTKIGQHFISKFKLNHHEVYREAVGTLMYFMVRTRPDAAFVIRTLGKFVETPFGTLLKVMHRVICYSIYSRDLDFVYNGTFSAAPTGFVDGSWAGVRASKKSKTGCLKNMSGGAVSLFVCQEEVFALSLTKAEYIALCNRDNKSFGSVYLL